jgi:hypothetical protein
MALILALTRLPRADASQKVALPNGEVLHFAVPGGGAIKHSTDIMKEGFGPPSVLWYILDQKPVVWDSGDKEAVVQWINSSVGQSVVRRWMDHGDSHGTIYPGADTKLRNYFEHYVKIKSTISRRSWL